MNTNELNPVVLPESDFRILKRLAGSKDETNSLSQEIQRAIIVKDSAFPPNTIRINTTVRIRHLETAQESEYKIVLPNDADIRSRKISVLSPMGAALIGFREGDVISWKMPGGLQHFKVLKVA